MNMKTKYLIWYTASLILIFYFYQSGHSLAKHTQNNLISYTSKYPIVSIKQNQSNFGLPIRLKISKININTFIESVGLTLNNSIDTAKNVNNVAWFNLWTKPGDIGNAIISGHYGWINKKASIFNNLYKLHIGDKLSIENDQWNIINFVVRKSVIYDLNADTQEILISSDSKSHLNLITCAWAWNKITKSYPKRLVIFTDRIDE